MTRREEIKRRLNAKKLWVAPINWATIKGNHVRDIRMGDGSQIEVVRAEGELVAIDRQEGKAWHVDGSDLIGFVSVGLGRSACNTCGARLPSDLTATLCQH